jgi:CHAT domain-containing protein/Tfp pilus assembly protein PilF
LAIYERLNPWGDGQGSLWYGLGQVAFERRDLDVAQQHYQRALSIFERANAASPELPIALHGLADVALDREDFSAAEQYLRRALAIDEKLAPRSERSAWDLRCLALALAGKGDVDAAWVEANRSLEIREQLVPGSYEVSASLATVGKIALARGDTATASKRYGESLAIRSRQAPGSAMEGESLYGLASAQREQGQIARAAETLERAIATLDQQGRRLGGGTEARSTFGAGYARCYRDYVEVLLELGRTADAFHALERSRARGFLTLLAERDVRLGTEAPREIDQQLRANHAEYDRVQTALSRLRPPTDGAEIDRLHGRLRELREDAREIISRVRQVSPRAAALRYPEPLDLSAAREALDTGTTLIAYSVGEKETSLFALAASPGAPRVAVFSLPVGRKALQDRIERYRRSLESSDEGSGAAAADLYQLLVGPAEGMLESSRRLLISPDGALHLLPFGSLVRNDRDGRRQYLVEWKPLHIVASATVYAEIKKGRSGAHAEARLALAAFGDPQFPQASSNDSEPADPELQRLRERGVRLSPLPSTREEVRGIAALYPGARTFLGEAATESRLKAVAQEARYLHIASHAILDEGLPLNSGIAFTVPKLPEPGRDNGFLQAWEIFDGPKIDADLVTLSACKTALGKDMAGDGLLGLTRAFQYAGARSVLASLWSVADRSTAKLMRSFYGQLAAGKPKDESLRAAQIEMIRAGGPNAHPRHWAAFQLFGDWR